MDAAPERAFFVLLLAAGEEQTCFHTDVRVLSLSGAADVSVERRPFFVSLGQQDAWTGTAQGRPLLFASYGGAHPLPEEASPVSLVDSPFLPRLHGLVGQGVSHMFYCSQPRPL